MRSPAPNASATRSGAASSRTPSASKTSALPHWLETARLPCFATRTPAPASTIAAAVDTLKVARHRRLCHTCRTRRRTSCQSFTARDAHRLRKPDELGRALAFQRERHEHRGDLRRLRVAVHDRPHELSGLGARQVLVPAKLLEQIGAKPSMSASRKFRSSRMPTERQHRLRMELHAKHRIALVPNRHDRAFPFDPRRHHEARRHGVAGNDERVVPAGLERVLDSGKKRGLIVRRPETSCHASALARDRRGHRTRSTAPGVRDTRQAPESCQRTTQRIDRHPGRLRPSRTRRHHEPIRPGLLDPVHGNRVVADDLHVRAKLTKPMREVQGEGIVIVNQ